MVLTLTTGIPGEPIDATYVGQNFTVLFRSEYTVERYTYLPFINASDLNPHVTTAPFAVAAEQN
jgi:hypothetical protein